MIHLDLSNEENADWIKSPRVTKGHTPDSEIKIGPSAPLSKSWTEEEESKHPRGGNPENRGEFSKNPGAAQKPESGGQGSRLGWIDEDEIEATEEHVDLARKFREAFRSKNVIDYDRDLSGDDITEEVSFENMDDLDDTGFQIRQAHTVDGRCFLGAMWNGQKIAQTEIAPRGKGAAMSDIPVDGLIELEAEIHRKFYGYDDQEDYISRDLIGVLYTTDKKYNDDNFDIPKIVKAVRGMVYMDDETEMRTEYRSITRNKQNGFTARLKVMNPGSSVGYMDREFFDGDKFVTHDMFSIVPGSKGKGFATRWLENAERAYKEAGFQGIKTFANLDVGGYAWAKLGFDFESEGDRDRVLDIIKNVWEEEYQTRLPKDIENSLVHSWDMAALTGSDGQTIGKKAMARSGCSWFGVKTFGTQCDIIGNHYYRAKKKSKTDQ